MCKIATGPYMHNKLIVVITVFAVHSVCEEIPYVRTIKQKCVRNTLRFR